MQTTQQKLEVRPGGPITVYTNPESAVILVGGDGTVATVMSSPGEMSVTLEQQGKLMWTHTFKYTLPAERVQPVAPSNGPVKRPRGRPRLSGPARERLTLDDSMG